MRTAKLDNRADKSSDSEQRKGSWNSISRDGIFVSHRWRLLRRIVGVIRGKMVSVEMCGSATVTAKTLKEKLSLNVMKLYRDDPNPDSRISRRKFIFKISFRESARMIRDNFSSFSIYGRSVDGRLTNI